MRSNSPSQLFKFHIFMLKALAALAGPHFSLASYGVLGTPNPISGLLAEFRQCPKQGHLFAQNILN